MGADGHIYIWRDDKVRAAFPDCDKLFNCLPTHYADKLDGVLYHHCYYDSSSYVCWEEPSDWHQYHFGNSLTPEQAAENAAIAAQLPTFVEWLLDNQTHWEVWT